MTVVAGGAATDTDIRFRSLFDAHDETQDVMAHSTSWVLRDAHCKVRRVKDSQAGCQFFRPAGFAREWCRRGGGFDADEPVGSRGLLSRELSLRLRARGSCHRCDREPLVRGLGLPTPVFPAG